MSSLLADAPAPGVDGAGKSPFLDRVFEILDAFTGDESVLSLIDLARRVDLPKATVHRLAARLVHLGALERTPDNRYQLGMRMFTVGAMVPVPRHLREAALPHMEQLFETFHETVHLAVLDGDDVLYIERIAGQHVARLPTRVGGRFPAHASAVGKALLAFTPRPERPPHSLTRTGPRTVVHSGQLAHQLSQVRRDGFAVEYEESVRGICCVGAPIPGTPRGPLSAVSVAGAAHRMDVERVSLAVRRAARAIAGELTAGLVPAMS